MAPRAENIPTDQTMSEDTQNTSSSSLKFDATGISTKDGDITTTPITKSWRSDVACKSLPPGELDFLKRFPARRRWKNKRFWTTPVRHISGGKSSTATTVFASQEDEAVTKRRSLLHDSLSKLDDSDTKLGL